MQQTYQDRLNLDATQKRWLDAFGSLYGQLQRKLYAHAAKGEKLSDLKSAFSFTHGISARQFNAMRIELEGKIAGTVELLKVRKKDLSNSIKKTTNTISKIDKSIKEQEKLRDNEKAAIAKNKKPKVRVFDLAYMDKLIKRKFNQNLRLTIHKNKLKDVDARLKAPVPGICFGSRKLFKQQFHLELTEFMQHGETHDVAFKKWRAAWLASRSSQFFLVGSKDETAGNQSCKARVTHAAPSPLPVEKPTLTLTVKMPQALVAKGAPDFLVIEKVHFNYGQDQVLKAIENGIALSYRFHRDDHTTSGWRVFVSTDTADANQISLSIDLGVIGVDFNADHLAWAHTDRFGNASNKPDRFGRIDLLLKGKSTEQREAILSEALDKIFAIAKKFSCPVGIEDLDFAVKKKELSKLGVKHARMLSGLAYAKYQSLARGKASRLGIELIFVDPAYTSVAGSVKYAVRLGRTVHQAAAGVIARRAQGFKEKRPKRCADRSTTYRAPLMGNTAVLTLPAESGQCTRASWATIRKSLTQHCAEQVRVRKDASRQLKFKSELPVNTHPLDETTVLSREPGESLARRPTDQPNLPDLPF